MANWLEKTLFPNGTLKNKLNITNQDKLTQIEMKQVANRTLLFLNAKPKIKSLDDLAKIHKFLFESLYDWAGKYRPGNMHKGNAEFMEHESFDFASININRKLDEVNQKSKPTNLDYAELLDTINYMHPFREGNGRSTRLFLQALAANHSQFLDYSRHDQELIEAENKADVHKLAKLITVIDTNSKKEAFSHLKEQARKVAMRRRGGLER